jgi:hypothetical protein
MKPFTYRVRENLPSVPDHFIQQLLEQELEQQWINTEYSKKYTTTRNGIPVKSVTFQRFAIPSDLEDWLRKNITDKFHTVSYQVMSDSDTHPPHTDVSGKYKLNYMVKTGGDNVITTFYKTDHEVAPGFRAENFEGLTPIDQYHANAGQWIQLNVGLLHGVDNVQGQRSAITLVFDQYHDF